MSPSAPAQAADRNLLFGVLALQMNFISRDDLVAALHAWVLNKHKPLGQIFRDQGRLTAGQLDALDALLEQHLLAHGDPQRSLRALPAAEEAVPLLARVPDTDLEMSLASLTPTATEPRTIDYASSARAACRYRVLRPHASGGLGEVFVAVDTELHREVALKEIRRERADDPDSRARFLLEAEVTGGLEHPGVVPVYGLGTYADGRPYYAMRLIKGDSLKDAIERFHDEGGPRRDAGARRREMRLLLRRFIDACNAVAYAHSRGVLHRDLKPSNVMLGKFGETLVVDWGLAKAGLGSRDGREAPAGGTVEPSLRPSSGSDAMATQEGAALGTPSYMSPEQAAGRLAEVGPASDIYGLGATLYALLTGRLPFEGPDMGEVLSRVRAGRVAPPRQVRPDTPAALDAVCRKAMALRPADRYATALDLTADVEHWLADEPVGAYPEAWPARAARRARRHRTAVVAAGVLLVSAVVALSLGVALVWREQRKTDEQRRLAEENFRLARDLGLGTLTLIESAEAQFAASPGGQRTRKEVLTAASRALRQYLAQKPDDPELRQRAARVYRFTANVHRLGNETDAADQLYRDSLRLYEGLAEDFPAEAAWRERLAEVLRDYASLQGRVGRLREASDSLRRALGTVEALRAAEPDRASLERGEATVLLDLAANEKARGLVGDAGQTAGRAAERFRELLTRPPGERHVLDPLLLAACLNIVAVAEREAGRLDQARSTHVEAVKLLQGMIEKPPEGVNQADVLHFMACCRVEQARTWAKTPQRRANAEKNLGATAEQWLRLARSYPAVPMYRDWRAVAHLARGKLRAEDGRAADARADFDQARQLLEALVQEYPQIPGYRGDLGRAYAGLARLARGAGDRAVGADWFNKAADALGRAVEQSPDHAEDRQSLEEVRAEQAKRNGGRDRHVDLVQAGEGGGRDSPAAAPRRVRPVLRHLSAAAESPGRDPRGRRTTDLGRAGRLAPPERKGGRTQRFRGGGGKDGFGVGWRWLTPPVAGFPSVFANWGRVPCPGARACKRRCRLLPRERADAGRSLLVCHSRNGGWVGPASRRSKGQNDRRDAGPTRQFDGGGPLLPLPLQFRDEFLKIGPPPQGIEVGVFLHGRHALVALAHRITEQLHRRVAVELRRLLALPGVQLVVLGHDGDAQAQKTRGVVGVRGGAPAHVPTGFSGAEGVLRLQQPGVGRGQHGQMAVIELSIVRVPGVRLQGGQVVRPALQKQLFGGGPVPLLLVEGPQVHVGTRQFAPQVRLVGEVGREPRVDGEGLTVVLLRLPGPARDPQEGTPVDMAAGQHPPEFGSGGEVGRQLFVDAQGLVEVRLRLFMPPQVPQQTAAAVEAVGQLLAEVGSGGEVGRQLLLEAQGVAVILLRLREPAHVTPEDAPVEVAAGQFLAGLRPFGKVGRQLLEDAQGRVPVRLRFLEPARITPDHAPVGKAVGQRLPELGSGGRWLTARSA